MANITAQMVKGLREATGLPMMECKQALTENNGDSEAARAWLRKKHKGKMADRADRQTGEGRVSICINDSGTVGGIIELQCETAPVAKNDLFVGLADAFAKVAAGGVTDPEQLRAAPGMDAQFTEVYGKLRETMNLTRAHRVEGAYLSSYIHHDGKIGVLVAFDAVPTADSIGPDLCMHAAFANPLAIDRDGVPADQVEAVRTEARELAVSDGKKPEIVEKIVEGKVNAFYAEKALMEQLHARSDVYGKKKVRDVLKEAGVSQVVGLVYLKVGG